MSGLFVSLICLTWVQAIQQDVSAADILQRLDLNSFPNSTGPRKVAGWKYPADWSFTVLREEGGSAVLERPGAWAMSLRIIRRTEDGIIVCFFDHAQNGGNYSARSALRIVGDGAGGYRVAEEVEDPTCEPLPGQG
ncbi:MAG: hypothetical protein EON90_12975 [Brevundimonas sp.]|nr:MAG: hypothetical protein EON90_12975 [Brevundimonas sp.]